MAAAPLLPFRRPRRAPTWINNAVWEHTFLDFIERRAAMVVAEYRRGPATVRIHDEYCLENVDRCLENISGVVSGCYRRRRLEEGWDARAARGEAGASHYGIV